MQPKIQIWSVSANGGVPKLIADGDDTAPAPDSDRVVFVRNRQIWIAPIDGSKPAQQFFYARGTSEVEVHRDRSQVSVRFRPHPELWLNARYALESRRGDIPYGVGLLRSSDGGQAAIAVSSSRLSLGGYDRGP